MVDLGSCSKRVRCVYPVSQDNKDCDVELQVECVVQELEKKGMAMEICIHGCKIRKDLDKKL